MTPTAAYLETGVLFDGTGLAIWPSAKARFNDTLAAPYWPACKLLFDLGRHATYPEAADFIAFLPRGAAIRRGMLAHIVPALNCGDVIALHGGTAEEVQTAICTIVLVLGGGCA